MKSSLSLLLCFFLAACSPSAAKEQTKSPTSDDMCKEGPCVAEQEAQDKAMVDRALRTMTPAEFIKAQKATGDNYSRCPDTGYLIDQYCQFNLATGRLIESGSAEKRTRAAIRECTNYDQTTINFCLGKVSERVEAELDRVHQIALSEAQKSDAERISECNAGRGLGCAAGMRHKQYLQASQEAWTNYADNQCNYQTEGNVDGTGYASFGMICWLKLAADRIDQLQPKD